MRELETWLQAKSPLDRQSRYAQSACAVHYMAVQHGVPAIMEYFRLFKERFDAAQNFVTAFGKSSDTFARELRAHDKSTRELGPLN